jgi:hypothetical protein
MRFRVNGKVAGGIEGRHKKGIKYVYDKKELSTYMILCTIDVFSILDQRFVHYITVT